MDRPFEGYNKNYSSNYNKIFRKSFWERLQQIIDNVLMYIFVGGKNEK